MKKEKIIEFFDSMANSWDKNLIINADKLNRILDFADINDASVVLDVACGTGVLFSYYIERNVQKVIGVDFSQRMLDLAREKFKAKNIELYCADVENFNLQEKANRIVVFNAFPHFIEPEKIIENLACNLQKGGRMTIAHDMGRAQLDFHHSGIAKEVSKGLIPATETAKLMEKYFNVDTIIDEEDIYVVSGERIK